MNGKDGIELFQYANTAQGEKTKTIKMRVDKNRTMVTTNRPVSLVYRG